MMALLREFPGVRVTFNLVPSLLVQLEAFAADQARDRFLELSLKPTVELTGADAVFLVENFFHAQRQRMIEAYPRYAGLLARRGALASPADAKNAARRFSREDLRDLQVWHKLAWIDPSYLADSRVRATRRQGPRLQRKRQGGAAHRRAGDSEPGDPGVPARRLARPDRAVDLPVLSPDLAAPVRHGHLPPDAP
jgi:alpha-amylase/alpha-mannosidase (GH57 family)